MMRIIKAFSLLIMVCIWGKDLRAAGDDEHGWHPHHVSVFAGFSYDMKDREGVKLGVEYIYRSSDLLALRTALDFTGKDYDELSISAGADIFPVHDVPFYLGIGLGVKNYTEKFKPFARLLGGYDFHVGKLSLSPLVIYDIYEKQNYLTFGLGMGIGF